ncbi:DUF1552 domain-containing protein [Telmatocola sphagniphila]|uniref:DUF1552 domain-containing protein n=1 Tax=Telmatocola sphagniphila TaxID=1123043 RepID=A0A8E6BCN2_9BACT|nr:DUF1552 domain-containing protein [Telmatocola sphagniphila]QVL34743.1 DUF1552 domain-containing protein [Telmatocola sphagniphila]
MNHILTRRAALKGLGTIVTLPWLETFSAAAPGSAAKSAPMRTAFFYVPNGVHMQDWKPAKVGADYELPWILEPLKEFKKDLNVYSGLTLDKARPNGDGAGDHARAQAAFLTGRQPKKTNGADIRAGQSADQWIANQFNEQTRFASLELGIEGGKSSGNCDSGYSCAYQSNFSWRGDSTPNAKEVDPKVVFERLFGNGTNNEKDATRAKREKQNKSILDFVMEDAKSLDNQLGTHDKHKMDEYLTAVRELEGRIERARKMRDQKPVAPPAGTAIPTGIPKDLKEHMRLMGDLMVLAFQTDMTRVVTLPLANDGSNRSHSFLTIDWEGKQKPVSEGHHEISHHQGNKENFAKLRVINRFHIEQLAYMVGRLKSIKEGEKSLLDNCMIVYGSGIGDGNRHNHDDLPIISIGSYGGKVKTGQHLEYAKDTPLMNLYLAMFDKLGCPVKSFGDSTGVLKI